MPESAAAALPLALTCLMLSAPAAAADPPGPPVGVPRVVASEPLVDLEASARVLSPETFDLRFDLPGVFRDDRGRLEDLSVTVVHLGGKSAAARSVATTRFIWGKKHAVDASGLECTADRLAGRLRVTLEPLLSPRGNRPADGLPHELEYEIEGRIVAESGSTWRLEGTFRGPRLLASGALADDAAEGPLAGTFRPPVRPGGWNRGVFDDGLRLRLDLGTERRNWNHVRAAVYELPEPRDLSAFSGLRLRIRRDDPPVEPDPKMAAAVWLREADGSWYYVKHAVPLCDAENEAAVLFEDFAEAEWVAPTGSHMDEDYVLDLSSISHLAVGIVNPLGVGEVGLAVRAIDLVRCEEASPGPATVTVTGRMLSVNGHERVPPGLFGGYAPDLPQRFRPGCQRYLSTGPHVPAEGSTELFKIDCWFDRYVSATLLGTGEWKERLAGMARAYARRARRAGYRHAHLEFWNEPYLNWAKPGGARNYRPDFYETARAGEGRPVIARKTGMVIPYFEWREAGSGWKMGDSTQFTYWSARGNGFLYDRMLLAVGETVKAENPDVSLLAGWDFRWNEDHWAAWDLLYRPTIDRAVQYIDGVTEHHYQGDTTAMNGAYEVLVAYGETRHNKRLYCYNTETNDLLDAPARGAVDTPGKARRATQYRRMVYNLRDILYCVKESPDKFLGRTVIHSVRGHGVEEYTRVAYGLMRNLRGRLVEVACDDPGVWGVASIDGTDPRAMPPDPGAPPTLVLVLFNDHRRPREVDLCLTSPSGTAFAGGEVERTSVDQNTFAIDLARTKAPVEAGQTVLRLRVALEERAAWKISLALEGDPPAAAEVRRRQFFSPDLLAEVRRGRPVRTTVRLDPDVLGEASRAWLRLVVEDIAPGEGEVVAAGRRMPLPKAHTADNVTRILELPLDVPDLAGETVLVFSVRPGNHEGYRVDLASVVLELRQEAPRGASALPGKPESSDRATP